MNSKFERRRRRASSCCDREARVSPHHVHRNKPTRDDEQKFDHVLKRFGDGKNLLGVSPFKSIVFKRTIKLL